MSKNRGSARINPLGVMWGLLAGVGLAVYFVLSASGDEPDADKHAGPHAGRHEDAGTEPVW